MPIVPPKKTLGRCRGAGPLLFVLPGLVPEQVSFGPQPKLPPFVMTLISSLHSGPFSVYQRRCVLGSNVKP